MKGQFFWSFFVTILVQNFCSKFFAAKGVTILVRPCFGILLKHETNLNKFCSLGGL